jgi:hypothetical protein
VIQKRADRVHVFFAMGRPSAQADRVADAVLDLRPGLLIVVAWD